jgi:hypothetical protein
MLSGLQSLERIPTEHDIGTMCEVAASVVV